MILNPRRTKMPKIVTTLDYITRFINKHGDRYDYEKFENNGSQTKSIITCKIHGDFLQSPDNHSHGQGCDKCLNDSLKLSHSQIIDKFLEVHGNRYDYHKFVYAGNKNKSIIVCPKCGEFNQNSHDHLKGYGCPKCKASKGESVIREYLTNNTIIFKEQKRFSDCRNKKPLPFDFYLPDHNICIEFDGQQHYHPLSFHSDQSKETKLKNLKIVQINDKIKSDYCGINNIKLIRIPYFHINNIESILTTNLTYFKYSFAHSSATFITSSNSP
jgi:very-short-patch-repair endonuclease